MIALYIIGAVVGYFGLGAIFYRVDYKDARDKCDLNRKEALSTARRTFFFWPVWLMFWAIPNILLASILPKIEAFMIPDTDADRLERKQADEQRVAELEKENL